MEGDTASSEPYVPSRPARLPGRVTATSVAVMTSLPCGAARAEAWEVEYGFRYTGGWSSAPWTGEVDEAIPKEKGRGDVWVCTITGLEPESSYIFRIRARAEGWADRGLGWGDWSERSSVIKTVAAETAGSGGHGQEQIPSGFLSAASSFLKEGIEGIRREIVSNDAEPPELNEWAAPVQTDSPPVVLTDFHTIEFRPDEGYMQVEDESEPSDGRFELGLAVKLYESRSRRQSRATGKPPTPPVLCIMHIARDSIAARKPTLRPGLEVISVMGRPASTLLRAGREQEEITASLAGIWRTCLELNQPLAMGFSKRVASQWVPEPKPEVPAVQKPQRYVSGGKARSSDGDDDLAKLQRDALQMAREDRYLEGLDSADDADAGLDRTASAALREVELAEARLNAKLAATDALLRAAPESVGEQVGDGTRPASRSSDGAGLVLMDADRTMSREGASRLAALDDMFAGSCQNRSGTDGDERGGVAGNHEDAQLPASFPDQTLSGAGSSSTGALLDELDALAGKSEHDWRCRVETTYFLPTVVAI